MSPLLFLNYSVFEHLLIICHDCKTRLPRIAQRLTKLALFPCYIFWLVKKLSALKIAFCLLSS